jgi:hypothetical protein
VTYACDVAGVPCLSYCYNIKYKCIMTAAVRAIILTHLTMFVAGFAAGKYINADELATYRELHESSLTRLKRRAGTVGFVILAVGAFSIVVRAARGGSKSHV